MSPPIKVSSPFAITAWIGRIFGIRWITDDNENRQIPFHRNRRVRLIGEEFLKDMSLAFDSLLQRIREVNVNAFGIHLCPPVCLQEPAEVEVRNRVRRDEQLKPEKPFNERRVHIGGPRRGAIGFDDVLPDMVEHFHEKAAGAGGRI